MAEADLMQIGRYTLRTWGIRQAERYLSGLEACCQLLADHAPLGRECGEIRPGLRRMEHGSHVIFFRQRKNGILVSRILHERMVPASHRLEDQR
uniref:ParE n=1 Tax=mine drainage metagenome TaxID=410659 RepID=E6QN11_9ZZZZ